jgi:transcriptional regulator with XRE-family HTH domain
VLGKRLKAARIAAKMTQTELAKRAGIDELTVSRISHYETDTHSPNFQQACRFAEVLGIPECYFYCRDDSLADQLLDLQKCNKKFRLNPIEISELEKAKKQLDALKKTIGSLLDKRTETMLKDQ